MSTLQRRTLANAVRALSMDAVQQANSGHPGAPMGMADIAEVLWRDYLQHNPANPHWPNRDRFILSNGHGSMLLYSLLHLSGYPLTTEDLKQFRQLHSKTPGHPEYGYTEGVETTTGPLGQGLANAVGMALAEKTLASQFNQPGFDVVNHFTYAFIGDGCLMEGISHEVCSLAGTQELGKLIVFYDDNGISIDGETEGWFTDDTPTRFRSYNWQVISNVDGHDAKAIIAAIEEARRDSSRPTLICCKTTIGYGSPNKAGSHDCHGAPLGKDEIQATKHALGWHHAPFEIPEDVSHAWNTIDKGQTLETLWKQLLEGYKAKHPELAAQFLRRIEGSLPADWDEIKKDILAQQSTLTDAVATRKCSQNTLQLLGKKMPELLGGSADLAPSNLTMWNGSEAISPAQPDGNYIHYGVREFGMTAIMNGVALYGGFIPYGGTFLMFMEYARNAVRMSALMNQRVIHIYTHDSIGLGEDGPTHQPIEQITALRVTPNLQTWRPCDQFETTVAWLAALERNEGPSAFILSRQNLPQQKRDSLQQQNVSKGGYILKACKGTPDVILIATGSEVALAMDSATDLEQQGFSVQVVSMPCAERFDQQPKSYRDKVLPTNIRARVAVECGHSDYWYKYVGIDGTVIGINRFGESAPASELMTLFGFTQEKVVETSKRIIQQNAH
ncbi:transketolase [Marinomonas foliarum]|uniref:Transketolase n=1 Tax=Marinomonas foliarum TaxID=491950 RepID=A0A368ZKY4_9GAMM|nr:transketolase [Marinomonas foliarum]RCW94964.1 transketolase [Marinomonas foliarum]